MTLKELEIIVGNKLRMEKCSTTSWVVDFPNVEVTDGHFQIGVCGSGRTQAKAKDDFARNLRGKKIVVNAYRPNRIEFLLPKTITRR